MPLKIDKKDLAIINILRENSRLSIRNIAKKTKIRPSTVYTRIKKLKQDNIIEKFTIKLNNKAIGEGFIAFMFITTKKELSKEFFKNPHLKECFGITGEFDLLLKLKFKDVKEFNSFLISLRKNKDIEKTLTMVSTITLKEEV